MGGGVASLEFEFCFRLDQPGPHRVEVNIIADRSQIPVATPIDNQCLVPPRKNVSAKLMPNIKSLGVEAQEAFHSVHMIIATAAIKVNGNTAGGSCDQERREQFKK